MTLEKRMKRAIKSNDIRIIHEVFEEIYVTYGKLVYFKIMQYVSNKLDVEELTQDVFVSFYNNLKCTDILDIKYYLVTSAKNKAVDFIKKKKVVLQSDDRVIFETSRTSPCSERCAAGRSTRSSNDTTLFRNALFRRSRQALIVTRISHAFSWASSSKSAERSAYFRKTS